ASERKAEQYSMARHTANPRPGAEESQEATNLGKLQRLLRELCKMEQRLALDRGFELGRGFESDRILELDRYSNWTACGNFSRNSPEQPACRVILSQSLLVKNRRRPHR